MSGHSGGCARCTPNDQNGLVSLPGEGHVVHVLSHMAKVHILLMMMSIRLELIATMVGCDTCMVTQPLCKVLWVNVVWCGPILPWPLGEDIVTEHVGSGCYIL